MPPMTDFEFGDIVLVRFPFTDQSGSKQRPAVVLSSQAYHQARADVILMAVTSQVRQRPGFGESMIRDWQAAGLLKASVIKQKWTPEFGQCRKWNRPKFQAAKSRSAWSK